MPGRRKAVIHVSRLGEVFAGRALSEHPFAITAIFGEAAGLAAVDGHEIAVRLPLAEVADLLGAIPASLVEDPEDFRHLIRTMDMLRRSGKARSADTRNNPG